MYKYTNIQIYKYTNTQIHKYTNTQILVNLLILVVVSLIRVRLDGEGEEVEASLVADEQGAGTVPAVARVCHLMRAKGIIIISQKQKMPHSDDDGERNDFNFKT